MRSPRWKVIRRVWITFGVVATILFNGWMLFSSRAQGFDKRILSSDDGVRVRESSEKATISREEQQERTAKTLLGMLREVSGNSG